MNAYVSKPWFIFITDSWITTSCLYCGWGDRRLTLLLRKLDHVCKLLSFYKRKASEISFNVFSQCLTTYVKESLVTCGCFCLFGGISCPPIVLFLSLCGPARARTHTHTLTLTLDCHLQYVWDTVVDELVMKLSHGAEWPGQTWLSFRISAHALP